MKLIFLTPEFYKDFSSQAETELKENRPYILFLICFQGLDFAVPFRSYISHDYCFKTVESTSIVKGRKTWPGIDYTKSVIVIDKKYISPIEPTLRGEQFDNIKFKEYLINKKFIQYIELYIKSFNRIKSGDYKNRDILLCKFSTLQNYHKELNIDGDYNLVINAL